MDSLILFYSSFNWHVWPCSNIVENIPWKTTCFQSDSCAVSIPLCFLLHLGALSIIQRQRKLLRKSNPYSPLSWHCTTLPTGTNLQTFQLGRVLCEIPGTRVLAWQRAVQRCPSSMKSPWQAPKAKLETSLKHVTLKQIICVYRVDMVDQSVLCW